MAGGRRQRRAAEVPKVAPPTDLRHLATSLAHASAPDRVFGPYKELVSDRSAVKATERSSCEFAVALSCLERGSPSQQEPKDLAFPPLAPA